MIGLVEVLCLPECILFYAILVLWICILKDNDIYKYDMYLYNLYMYVYAHITYCCYLSIFDIDTVIELEVRTIFNITLNYKL